MATKPEEFELVKKHKSKKRRYVQQNSGGRKKQRISTNEKSQNKNDDNTNENDLENNEENDLEKDDKTEEQLLWKVNLTKGKKVILGSCQHGKEGVCQRDVQSALEDYYEKYQKSKLIQRIASNNNNDNNQEEKQEKKEETEEISNNFKNVEKEVGKNIKELNENQNFVWIRGPQGIIVIYVVNETINPVDFLNFCFEFEYPNAPNFSRFLFKLYPLQETCFTNHENIINMSKNLIQQYWKDIPLDQSFAVVYKNRANKTLNRNNLVHDIAQCVEQKNKVNLSKPNVVILLQTWGRYAGMSIITSGNYAKYKEYNVIKLDGNVESKDNKQDKEENLNEEI